jgi:hypothetical protein
MTSFLRLTMVAALATLANAAQAQEVRGVNPADIDSRFDLIVKRVRLEPSGTTDVVTLKYDYKLNNNWGLNFELPAYTKLSVPGFSASGNGDLFARARWIQPTASGWIIGASVEAVLPIASRDDLGTGKYQLNAAALAVKPWSRTVITAFAVKQTTSVAGESDRAKFSNTELRLVPVVVLSDGWALTGEVRQTWEHRTNLSWQRVEGTINKQFTQHWAGALGYSQDFGDRKDRGAFSAAVKYFF